MIHTPIVESRDVTMKAYQKKLRACGSNVWREYCHLCLNINSQLSIYMYVYSWKHIFAVSSDIDIDIYILFSNVWSPTMTENWGKMCFDKENIHSICQCIYRVAKKSMPYTLQQTSFYLNSHGVQQWNKEIEAISDTRFCKNV